MFVETSRNEYGTPVDGYICETCGDSFTVCPAHGDRTEDDQWTGCLSPNCTSYDPARDADRLFDDGNVVSFDQRARPNLIIRRSINDHA